MNSSDKKTMKQVYDLVKELTPIAQAMKDIANERLRLIQLIKQIEPFVEEVEEIWNAEQDKFERRSQKWQESDAGMEAQEIVSHIESIKDNLEDCVYHLEYLQ